MLLKRLLAVFMVCMILFADSGQMIYAHVCLESGRTTFSFKGAKHCCCAKKDENCCKVAKSCCYDTSKYIKQVFITSLDDFHKKSFEPAPAVFVEGLYQLLSPSFISFQNTFPPPATVPLSKLDISLLQVFRC